MLNTTTAAVLLATSWAPLLSGQLHQCINADDPSCNGGVASFRAMLRHHSKLEAQQQDDALPFAHIQLLDKDSAFVHMHPLGLSVNRLILNELMGLDVFASSPSILLQNHLDSGVSSQDISYLQTHDMPLLISNVGVHPSNSWHPFTKAVHFDAETRLAIMSLSKTQFSFCFSNGHIHSTCPQQHYYFYFNTLGRSRRVLVVTHFVSLVIAYLKQTLLLPAL